MTAVTNQLVQEVAKLLRAWAPNDRARHDAIRLLSDLQGQIIIMEDKIEKLEDDVDSREESLRYLRRKIDGYDSTFEMCGFQEFIEE